jgi:hypothetical protein
MMRTGKAPIEWIKPSDGYLPAKPPPRVTRVAHRAPQFLSYATPREPRQRLAAKYNPGTAEDGPSIPSIQLEVVRLAHQRIGLGRRPTQRLPTRLGVRLRWIESRRKYSGFMPPMRILRIKATFQGWGADPAKWQCGMPYPTKRLNKSVDLALIYP